MKCPECGNEVKDGAKFCRHCGANLDQPRPAPAPQQPPIQVPLDSAPKDGHDISQAAEPVATMPDETSPIRPVANLTMVSAADETKCPKCGHSVKAGKVFCGECGAKIEQPNVDFVAPQTEAAQSDAGVSPQMNCSQCGHPLKEGRTFCGECGIPINGSTIEVEPGEQKSRKKKPLIIIAIILFVIIAFGAFGGIYIAVNGWDVVASKIGLSPQETQIPETDMPENDKMPIPTPTLRATELSETETPSPTPTPTSAPVDNDYILPQSNSTAISNSDIQNLTATQLKIAYYEIYARHGCVFTDIDVQQFFNQKLWYTGTTQLQNFQEALLNGFEKDNLAFLSVYASGTVSTPLPTANVDFIFPDSSSRYLTMADLANHTKDELRIARNEIYARRGRLFADADLQQYFSSKPWYNGTIQPNDFKESFLSDVEKKNLELIVQVENTLP